MAVVSAIIRLAVMLLAIGVGIVGVAMTFRYGLVFVNSEECLVYAALFACFDAIKCLLPSVAFTLSISGSRKMAAKATAAYFFLASLSMLAHIGLTITLKTGDAQVASVANEQHASAADEVTQLKAGIEVLGAVRPLGNITAELAQAERDPIFTDERRSRGCSNDTAPASLEFCRHYRALLGERDNARELLRLEAELRAARLRLHDQGNQIGGKPVTAVAETLAKKTGLDIDTVLLVIAILLAVGIELCSSQILEMAVAAGHKRDLQPFAAIPETKGKPLETAILPPLMAADDGICGHIDNHLATTQQPLAPKQNAADWISARLQAHRSANTPYRAAYAAAVADAEAAGLAPCSKNSFSRAITAAGYENKRQNRELMILGAVIKEQRAAGKGGLRVVKR